mmetsp:Transcript_608/g.1304  ORF Transcript_608/g.1304 Transcript_608/m.1304 type:complete len:93 (-) Transcript_608:267-545(-)
MLHRSYRFGDNALALIAMRQYGVKCVFCRWLPPFFFCGNGVHSETSWVLKKLNEQQLASTLKRNLDSKDPRFLQIASRFVLEHSPKQLRHLR